jgi:hypothetical protein
VIRRLASEVLGKRQPVLSAGIAAGIAVFCTLGSTEAYAGDVNVAACPNETLGGYTTRLPDCRGYELVSPPFKDGSQIQSVRAIAGDGTRVIGESTGSFAGTSFNYAEAYYELTRDPTGWVVAAINPLAASLPAQKFAAASADLLRTEWIARSPTESIYAEDLYRREENGGIVEVGPLIPPAAASGPPAGGDQVLFDHAGYVAASNDLSRVVFEMSVGFGNALWPGDTSVVPNRLSLYEYVGTNNTTPQLVGVSDGNTIIDGAAVPAGRLITDCGTRLGDEADAYNAMSASGETIAFTAVGKSDEECNSEAEADSALQAPEVSEIYARLGHAQTVAISEPSESSCETCNVPPTKALGRRPATLAGASEDGKRIYFLTEQELLTHGTTTNLYEYDFARPSGRKIVRVSTGAESPEVEGVARISEDGSHAYFVAKGVLTGADKEGRSPVQGANNLYVFESTTLDPDGRVAFVGTLSSETEAELQEKLLPCKELGAGEQEPCEEALAQEAGEVNDRDSPDWASLDFRPVQTTPDGRLLVFQSAAHLAAEDSGTDQQVYEYDAEAEELIRISRGQNGFPSGLTNANSHASAIAVQRFAALFGGGLSPAASSNALAVSNDGSTVVFGSTGALTAGAEASEAAGAESIYEYRSSGPIRDGDVYLISDGGDQRSAVLMGTDATGEDIFFETADPLIADDRDTQYDVYDARSAGGFPNLAQALACGEEACETSQAATQPQGFPVPGSSITPAETGPASGPTPVNNVNVRHTKPISPLTKALRACRRKQNRRRRITCEVSARRRFRKMSAKNVVGSGRR